MIRRLIQILFITLGIFTTAKAQVTEVKFLLKYDTIDCSWGAYIYIAKGQTTSTSTSRRQFSSSYSIVLPKGATIINLTPLAPFKDNDPAGSSTNVDPSLWQLQEPLDGPAATPDLSYHYVNNINGNFSYNDLKEGDSIKIFKFEINFSNPIQNCFDNVRLYRNGVDVGSEHPSFLGRSFQNGFTIGNSSQRYRGNLETGLPQLNTEIKQECNDGLKVNLNLEKSQCQQPYTFQWSGPGGFTSNQENIALIGNPLPGRYSVKVTDKFGCVQDTFVDVALPPSAGRDTVFCTSIGNYTLRGSNSTTAIWKADTNNPPGVTSISGTAAQNANVAFTAAAQGTYKFIYSSGACEDTVNVSLQKVNAGTKPNAQDCPKDAVFTMNAIGNGEWSIKSKPVDANDPSFDKNNRNTEVKGFNRPGTYILTWTVDKCSADIELVVGAPCVCTVDNILSFNPVSFCGTSTTFTINGNSPIPVADSYIWEINENNGGWLPAPGINNTQNYSNSGGLTSGEYLFRRRYINATEGCNKPSNEIPIKVNSLPNAGDAKSDLCAEASGGLVTMSASGIGMWDVFSNPSGTVVSILGVNNPTTNVEFSNPGNYVLRWTVDGCFDTTTVTIAAKPAVGADIEILCSDPMTRKAMLTATGSGSWLPPVGNPSASLFSTPDLSSTEVSELTNIGVYTFRYGSASCFDEVEVKVTNKANAGSSPGNLSCVGDNGGVYATNATNGPGQWQLLSSVFGASLNFVGSQNDAITQLKLNQVEGAFNIKWTDKDGCTDTLIVNVTTQKPSGADQTSSCQDLAANASFVMNALGDGAWSNPGGNPGAAVISSPTSASTVVTGFGAPGRYTFKWTASNGCEDFTDLTVKENPDAGKDTFLNCIVLGQGSITMNAQGLGTWTPNSNVGTTTISDPDNPMTEIQGFSSPGTYFFRFTDSGCATTIKIEVTPKANAGLDDNSQVCVDLVDAVAKLGAAGAGSWAAVSSNKNSLIVSETDPTTVVRNFEADGTYLYEWTSGGCTDTVAVIVAGKSNAGADTTISCILPSDLIVSLSATGIGRWSDVFGLQYSDRNSPTSTVRNFNNAGTYILKWDNNGCADEVFITINSPANAGANPAMQKCYSDARVTLNAAADPQGTWISHPSNPGLSNIVSSNTFSTEVNSFKAPGTYIFIWKTIFNCEDTVSVVIGGECLCPILDNTISTTSPLQYCKDADPITITGPVPTPAGGTFQWQVSINNGTYVNVPGQTSQNLTTSKLAAGIYNYRRLYSTTAGFICDDPSIPVKIVVAVPPKAGGDYPLICLPINQLTAPLFTATPGVWRALDGGLIAQPNMASTTVGGFTRDGINRIELEANGCRDTMNVTVKIEANAGDDKKEICITNLGTASFKMNAVGAGTWSKVNPTDGFLITSPSDSATVVNGFTTPGEKVLIWTKNNGCTDTVKLSVTSKPKAGADIPATCVSFTTPYFTNLNAQDTGTWRSILSGVNIANPTAKNASVGPFTIAGTFPFEYSYLGCLDTAEVIVSEGVKINAANNVSCFQDSTFALSASSSGGIWTASLTNKSSIIANPAAISTKIGNFASGGTYKYYYTKGGCVDSVSINVGSNCNCAITGNFVFAPTSTFCGTSTVTVSGSKALPAGGSTSWLLSKDNQAFASIPGGNDTLVNLASLIPGSYKVRKVYTITTCSDTIETLFVVNPVANAGSDTVINCVSYPFSYTTSAIGNGFWSTTSNASIFNVNSATTIINNINNPGTLKFYWNAGGCIDSFSLTTTLGVSVPRKDSTISCVVTTATGQLIGRGIGTWSQVGTLPSTATISSPNSAITNITNLNNEGRYRFIYSNGTCSDSTAIIIGKNADAGMSKPITCAILPHTDILDASGTGIWNYLSGPVSSIIDRTNPKSRVENIDSAGVYSYEWTETAGCKDTVSWTITSKPIATIDLTSSDCNQTAVLTATSTDNGTWVKDEARSAGTFNISSTTTSSIQVSNFSTKGTYYLVRVGANGCTDTLQFTIDNKCVGSCQIDNNVITIATPQHCENQGTIRINGSSPIQGPGTYRWIYSKDSINYQTAIGSSTGFFYDNPVNAYIPGKYFFRRIYSLAVGGCIDTSNVIALNIVPSPSGGTNRSVLCWNKEFTTFTGIAGVGYRWEFVSSDPPQLKVRIQDNSLATSRVDSFSGPGRYSFKWTNGICESFVDVVARELCDVPCNLANNKINGDTVLNCVNLQSILFNGPTASPEGGQYLWQILRNGLFVDAPAVNTIEDYRPDSLPVGQHIFRRLYQFGQCGDTSNQVVVNIIPAPSVPNIIAPATVCEGLPLSIATTIVSGYTYRWTGPNGFLSSIATPIIPNIQASSSGTYRLVVGNGGCFSDTANTQIKVIAKPRTPIATNNLPICDGQDLVIMVNKSNGVTYTISNNFNEITNDTIYTKLNATMNDEGNYIINADSLGCKSTPLTMNIKLNRVPLASIDKSTIQCFERDSARLSVNGTAGTWSALAGNPGTSSIGIGSNPIVKGFTLGGIYQFVWDNGSCKDTVSLNVGSSCRCDFPENVLIQRMPDFICSPTDTIVIMGKGAANNAVNYRWETNQDSIYQLGKGVNNMKDYAAGLISSTIKFRRIVTLKSDSLCRDTSNVVSIGMIDLNAFGIQLSEFNNPICLGDTTSINWLNPLSFLQYRWTSSGGIKILGADTLATVRLLGNSATAGKLTLNITDKRCKDTFPDIPIMVADKPIINLGIDTTICTFDQILSQYVLNALGYTSVLWSDGSTNETLVVTEKGVYGVEVTNAAGCKAIDSIAIAEFCCNINFPNVIKVTSGNENNAFNIDHTDCVLSSTLKIYDRWGNLVFQSKDVTEKWDGTKNGENVEEGVYVFIFEYEYIDQTGSQVKGKKSGDITVIR